MNHLLLWNYLSLVQLLEQFTKLLRVEGAGFVRVKLLKCVLNDTSGLLVGHKVLERFGEIASVTRKACHEQNQQQQQKYLWMDGWMDGGMDGWREGGSQGGRKWLERCMRCMDDSIRCCERGEGGGAKENPRADRFVDYFQVCVFLDSLQVLGRFLHVRTAHVDHPLSLVVRDRLAVIDCREPCLLWLQWRGGWSRGCVASSRCWMPQ
jgi:hypothetical protein